MRARYLSILSYLYILNIWWNIDELYQADPTRVALVTDELLTVYFLVEFHYPGCRSHDQETQYCKHSMCPHFFC